MKQEYRNFVDGRKFVRKLNLKNGKEWKAYCRSGDKPADIPSSPNRNYKNIGWISMGDFLGTGRIATYNIIYRSFKDARKFVQTLNLKSGKEWTEYTKSGKKPHDIPNTPDHIYKNIGWISMGDFLGTCRIADQLKKYRSFGQSRLFVQKLKLRYREDFKKLVQEGKIPTNIPSAPNNTYKKEWKGWGDFLGTGWVPPMTKSKNLLNYKDAKKQARGLAKKYNLKTWDDWINAHKEGKIPKILPQRPDKTYSKKKEKK